MTTRTLVAWVEPFAAKLRDDNAQVLAFARALPTDAWERPSGLEGWLVKDVLAHIGKGNDQLFQKLLRQVIAGGPIDIAIFRDVDTDGENARGVEERRGNTPEELIAELEEAGEEIQDLLSQLTEEHEHLRQEDPPFILKTFLPMVEKESHSLEHMAQLQAALEGSDV